MEHKTKGVVFLISFILLSLIYSIGYFFPYDISTVIVKLDILLITLSTLFLFLSVYNFSFVYPKKRRRVAIYINLALLVLALIATRRYGEWAFIGWIYNFGFFVVVLVLSILIAHFYLQLEKVKYSFMALLPISIAVIIFGFFQIFDFQRHTLNLHNIMEGIEGGIVTFFLIFSHISFIILLGTNIYLNKKKEDESKKRKILLFLIPLIIIVLLIILSLI